MTNQMFGDGLARYATFGHRRVTPRACVADSKRHLRAFLTDILEDLGFVTSECAKADELGAILETQLPDLIVLGVSVDGIEVGKILETLVRQKFDGRILALGARESIIVKAVRQVGKEYGLTMLPALTTPFAAGTLRERVAMLLPEEPKPSPAVNVPEALHAGWLELWYQQKVDARTLVRCGAEALVRVRHPTWGVVPPAYFIPEDDDPYFLRLSEFVIERATEDWRYLFEQQNSIDISINLPVSFLKNRHAVRGLCRRIPAHPAFGGLLIEIDGAEVIANLDLLVDVAKEVRFHNIAISIDNLGADWPALMGTRYLPLRRTQGRQTIRHRLRQRPSETDDLPSHRRIRQSVWRPGCCGGSRDPRRFSRGERVGLRPGPGLSVRQAHGAQEIRPFRAGSARACIEVIRHETQHQPSRLICSSVTTRSTLSVLLLMR